MAIDLDPELHGAPGPADHAATPATGGDGPALNLPEVIAEVRDEFARYERALVEGDQATMAALFWDSPMVSRFGLADAQVGTMELAAHRAARGPQPPGRKLEDTRVVAFGRDLAVVTTCFRFPGETTPGRQSQTWVRLPEGWRIVHAHVSRMAGSPEAR